MRRYSIMYFISQAFKGLWRNGVMTLASILVLMSCLIVMGSFGLIVININSNLDELGGLNEIAVFLEMDLPGEESAALGETIKSYPNVKTVEFISRDTALEEERAKYENDYPHFFDGVTSDIYSDEYVVSYENNNDVEALRFKLSETPGVRKVVCRTDVAEKIENLKQGIIYVFVWFLVILFVVSLFVIINTIKLAVFARRQEISVMRYVGATNGFIMVPFVLEGAIIGLFSSGIAYVAQYYIYKFVNSMFTTDYNMIKIVPFGDFGFNLGIAFFVIGVITGIIGSSISLRKNLRA